MVLSAHLRSFFAAAPALLAVLAAIGGFQPAKATPAGFDGAWTVLIITQAGSCDQGYSFPVQISGGQVTSSGMANITGTVGRGGGVTVRVTQGGSYATGTGRLGATGGAGRWSGRGSSGACSGRWQATRS
jgi:hypothetical protein